MSLDLLKSIIDNPIPYAHALGYTKLTEELHGPWIKRMLRMVENGTIQGHRGSYKTSCLIIVIALWMISRPTENLIFLRKSQEDVKDVLGAVAKCLRHPVSMELMRGVYGKYPRFTADSTTEIELDIYKGAMGRQVLGLGLKSSITGKHGSVITDDIVTLKDRISAAERTATKNQYMELVNIASEDYMNIFNTGTPWHKEDAFTLMPKPDRFTVYETGILSPETIQERKDNMSPSLFAANYELKHVSDGDVLFREPEYGPFKGGKVFAQIDAAYGGEDANSLTIGAEVDGKIHIAGFKMPGHVELHYNKICSLLERFGVVECYLENNADKGFLKKELEKRTRTTLIGYHERMNKYYKITTYGKSGWNRVIVDIDESDAEYIAEIMDFNENAEHDDCPDSFASLVRRKYSIGETTFHRR